jgi:hypothetical protein
VCAVNADLVESIRERRERILALDAQRAFVVVARDTADLKGPVMTLSFIDIAPH